MWELISRKLISCAHTWLTPSATRSANVILPRPLITVAAMISFVRWGDPQKACQWQLEAWELVSQEWLGLFERPRTGTSHFYPQSKTVRSNGWYRCYGAYILIEPIWKKIRYVEVEMQGIVGASVSECQHCEFHTSTPVRAEDLVNARKIDGSRSL